MRKSAWLRRDASGIDEIHVHEFADTAAFSCEYGDRLDEEDGATDRCKDSDRRLAENGQDESQADNESVTAPSRATRRIYPGKLSGVRSRGDAKASHERYQYVSDVNS